MPPSLSLRLLPAMGLHLVVATLDLAVAAGEGAIRIGGLFFGVLLGDKALTAAVEGLLRYLFVGNLWWPVLHTTAAVVLLLTRWRRPGWVFGAVLIGGRCLFLASQGRPYFDIGGGRWSDGFIAFYWGGLVLLGLAQALAFVRSTGPASGAADGA